MVTGGNISTGEYISGGSPSPEAPPEAPEDPNAKVRALVGSYHAKYAMIAEENGLFKSTTHSPAIDTILKKADTIYEQGLDSSGDEQINLYTEALAKLNEVNTIN